MSDTEARLDGNAAGGLLGELFSVDLTVATTWCRGCGAKGTVGELHVYTRAPGMGCPRCETLLMTVVRGGGRYWLDFSGTMIILIPDPG